MRDDKLSDLQVNRSGKTTEFKRGHHYLTLTEWEDGHYEIEVHKCVPKLIFHSCDLKELQLAKDVFARLPLLERKDDIKEASHD